MSANQVFRVTFALGMLFYEFVFSAPVATNNTVLTFTQDQLSHSSYAWTQPDATVEQIKTLSQTAFGSNMLCPTTVYESANDPLNKRSTCPWIYETDHDSMRFPTTILRATPLCTYCIGSGGKYECNPIFRNMTVLRQDKVPDANGNYRWMQSEYTTTVAYTCAGRRIANNIVPAQSITAAPSNPGQWAR